MSLTNRKKVQVPPINEKKSANKNIVKIKQKKESNSILPILSILISSSLFAFVYLVLLKENNLIPFNSNPSSSFFSTQIDSKKWGSFRSGHYFGLKTLAKQSLVFGLMWFENRIIDNNIRIRHWCDQSDNLIKYGWLKHDFHSFGIQEILDNDLNITTSFIIVKSGWRARVSVDFNEKIKHQIKNEEKKVNSIKTKRNKHFSFVPYFALDSFDDDNEEIWVEKDEIDLNNESVGFQIKGKTKQFINGFQAKIIVNDKDLIYSSGLNSTIDPPLLKVKENVMENLFLADYPGEEMSKNNYLVVLRSNLKSKKSAAAINKESKTNLALRQLIIKVPSVIDFEFEEIENLDDKSTNQNTNSIDDYNNLLKEKEQNFDLEFENKFMLKEKGFSNDHIKFAKAALSNMLGSVGSFDGFSQISLIEDNQFIKKENRKIYKYGPLSLLTSVPSRSFFPRGFLWDEGFHNLLISKFDLNLSKIILSSWFNLMNKNGWIPREVILGVEAEERIPNEFIVQNVHIGNPPTFFLLVDSILDHNQNNAIDKVYFNELFDKLVVWYDWFNRTQIGSVPGSYRWRGRNPTIKTELNVKTLSSGLDDYPRASSPTDKELHLDLLSWMMFATRTLKKLSEYLDHPNSKRFNEYSNWLTNEHLDKLHWSEENQMYCDIGLHSNKVILKKIPINNDNDQFISVRKELEPATYGCVNEFGYVSLFPFLLQLIEPTNPHLNILLNKLTNQDLIWSKYGLRSLSKNSSYYNARNTEHDPPYWRNAIWININYLTLKSLNYYSNQNGPYREKAKLIYNELKANLITNVYNQYKNRNYLYENYDDQTGEGKGCYPFTGWTTLIVLIMSDNYN